MNNVYSIQETFAGKILQVPDYQRGYAWERRHCDELLEDLEFLVAGKEHYTGCLVLHKQNEAVRDDGGQRHEVYHIVDGQQRLATLVLLLDAIRAKLTTSQPKLGAGVAKSYIQFADQAPLRAHAAGEMHPVWPHFHSAHMVTCQRMSKSRGCAGFWFRHLTSFLSPFEAERMPARPDERVMLRHIALRPLG
jgi:hypothetical protein